MGYVKWLVGGLVIAGVLALTLGASSTARFQFQVTVTTPQAGDIVRVHWTQNCDGVKTTGQFVHTTPIVKVLPAHTCQSAHAVARAWNRSHHHGPRFPVVVVSRI